MERVLFGHQTFSATVVCWCRQYSLNFWGNCKGRFFVLFMYKLPQWQLLMYIVKYCIDWTDGYSCCLHVFFILPFYGVLYPVVHGVIHRNLPFFLLCNWKFSSGPPLLTWDCTHICSSDCHVSILLVLFILMLKMFFPYSTVIFLFLCCLQNWNRWGESWIHVNVKISVMLSGCSVCCVFCSKIKGWGKLHKT